jgi:hypothetical protein
MVSLIDSQPEEMQNKFGEDSVWVYEVLRYVDATLDLILSSRCSIGELIEMKVVVQVSISCLSVANLNSS